MPKGPVKLGGPVLKAGGATSRAGDSLLFFGQSLGRGATTISDFSWYSKDLECNSAISGFAQKRMPPMTWSIDRFLGTVGV
jgi:hypothetical protein